jgi:hypothetical protein
MDKTITILELLEPPLKGLDRQVERVTDQPAHDIIDSADLEEAVLTALQDIVQDSINVVWRDVLHDIRTESVFRRYGEWFGKVSHYKRQVILNLLVQAVIREVYASHVEASRSKHGGTTASPTPIVNESSPNLGLRLLKKDQS